MKKNLYLTLAVLGLILPYSILADYLMKSGFETLLDDLFKTSISTFFVVDVVLSAIVVVIFIVLDSKAIKVKFTAIPITATLLVGPCCGLPLYLYLREIERASWVETVEEE